MVHRLPVRAPARLTSQTISPFVQLAPLASAAGVRSKAAERSPPSMPMERFPIATQPPAASAAQVRRNEAVPPDTPINGLNNVLDNANADDASTAPPPYSQIN